MSTAPSVNTWSQFSSTAGDGTPDDAAAVLATSTASLLENGEDVGLTDADLVAEMDGEKDVDALHDHLAAAEDDALQAWETASPAVNSDVDWTGALFNSDPRIAFQVLHLGTLLSLEAHALHLQPHGASDATSEDPFDDLRMGRSPVQVRRVPKACQRGSSNTATSRVAIVSPTLSPGLGRRRAAQRCDSALDDVIAARSVVALRQFVSPEMLAGLGRIRTSELWGRDVSSTSAKKSPTQSVKKER